MNVRSRMNLPSIPGLKQCNVANTLSTLPVILIVDLEARKGPGQYAIYYIWTSYRDVIHQCMEKCRRFKNEDHCAGVALSPVHMPDTVIPELRSFAFNKNPANNGNDFRDETALEALPKGLMYCYTVNASQAMVTVNTWCRMMLNLQRFTRRVQV